MGQQVAQLHDRYMMMMMMMMQTMWPECQVFLVVVFGANCINRVGWDGSVGTATCYGLDSLWIESRWG
jgi:hypothetical protein